MVLFALFIMVSTWWWVVLSGSNPYTVTNVGVVNVRGEAQEQFRPGEVVGIIRNICTSESIGTSFNPGLRNDIGLLFPLPGGVIHSEAGCRQGKYGFIMPNLPPGTYTYVNTVLYQSNLVGRDEHAIFPPLTLEVLP